MSLLEIYNNNPPLGGRQIRFKQGKVPGAPTDGYRPYERNDQASLRNSQLHYETPELPGYSTDRTPTVDLYSDRYFSVGERPSDLSLNQGKVIVDPGPGGFKHPYTPDDGYAYTAHSGDIQNLSALRDASGIINSLETSADTSPNFR